MEASVDICGQELIVGYEFKITSRGYSGCGPSFSSPGEPPEPCEFEITVHGARFPKQHADMPNPELPEWLKDVLVTHLMDRDDINDIVQRADNDPYYGRDPDWGRDLRNEDRERESSYAGEDY